MSRYTTDYWDTNFIKTPLSEECYWECKITDTETGITGICSSTHSSKAKAYDDAWEDLMRKQKDFYEKEKDDYKEVNTSQSHTNRSENENGLITLIIKGIVYILIIVGVLWLIFSVAIPIVIINIATIALIIGLVNKKTRRYVFPLSLLGTIFLIVDYNNGWFTKALATNVSFLAGLIPFFFYLNIITGLVAIYFFVRDTINKRNPPEEGTTEFSKRNVIIIASLIAVGGLTIGLQKYSESKKFNTNVLTEKTPIVDSSSNVFSNPSTIQETTPTNKDSTSVRVESNGLLNTDTSSINLYPRQDTTQEKNSANKDSKSVPVKENVTLNTDTSSTLSIAKNSSSIVGTWKGIKEASGVDFIIKKDKSCEYTASSIIYKGVANISYAVRPDEIIWAKSKIEKQFDAEIAVQKNGLSLVLAIDPTENKKMTLILFNIGSKLYAFAGGQSFYEHQ